jgi:hypothetical protein
MSVLLLGDDPITHRRCEGADQFDLLDWFATVEMQAWARVNAYFTPRPKEIFLVTGQHLTSAYAISHKRYGSSDCEVVLDCSGTLPSSGSTALLAQAGVTKVYASMGFEAVVGLPRPESHIPIPPSVSPPDSLQPDGTPDPAEQSSSSTSGEHHRSGANPNPPSFSS